MMYADHVTASMRTAIEETDRRRGIQDAYNREHGLEATTITKEIRDITDHVREVAEDVEEYDAGVPEGMAADDLLRMIKELEREMKGAAKNLEFEKAAALRDRIVELRRELVGSESEELGAFAEVAGGAGRCATGAARRGVATGGSASGDGSRVSTHDGHTPVRGQGVGFGHRERGATMPSRRAAIAMTDEEREQFLDEGWTLQVATNGPGGFPHLAAMWYVVIDGVVHFTSSGRARRS